MSANGVALLYANGVMEFTDFGRMGVRLAHLEVEGNLECILAGLLMARGKRNGGLQRIVPIKIDFMPSFAGREASPIVKANLDLAERMLAQARGPGEVLDAEAWLRFSGNGPATRRERWMGVAGYYRREAERARQAGDLAAASELDAFGAACDLEAGPEGQP